MEFLKILLAAALSYTAIFLSAKVIGHKQVSQLGFWDYITGITIGSIAAELATDFTQETIPVEVILDGRILDDNLYRMGLNAAWLQKQQHACGLHSAKEVFLAQCDDKQQLTLYLMSA